jgi:hypothetical protein
VRAPAVGDVVGEVERGEDAAEERERPDEVDLRLAERAGRHAEALGEHGGEHEHGADPVELLFFDGCPNHEAFEPRLRELVARRWPQAELRLCRVESDDDAQRLRFLGSPSVRVDGRDVEPGW